MVAALAFFLGKDEETKDKEDSDSDQEVNSGLLISFCQVTCTLFSNPVLSFYTGCRGFCTYVNFVDLSKNFVLSARPISNKTNASCKWSEQENNKKETEN